MGGAVSNDLAVDFDWVSSAACAGEDHCCHRGPWTQRFRLDRVWTSQDGQTYATNGHILHRASLGLSPGFCDGCGTAVHESPDMYPKQQALDDLLEADKGEAEFSAQVSNLEEVEVDYHDAYLLPCGIVVARHYLKRALNGLDHFKYRTLGLNRIGRPHDKPVLISFSNGIAAVMPLDPRRMKR